MSTSDVKIKICGLKRQEDIAFVNTHKPDFAGFVFAKSSRQITISQMREFRKKLHPSILAVGVFVNAELEAIEMLTKEHLINLVQLHGDEDGDYIARLKRRIPADVPLIKAVRVQSTEQILEAEQLSCDYLLLDTYQKGQYGGSGICFDKSLIPPLQKPFFLAGGLTVQNVSHEISQCSPFAVDVSSAVETDGYKDNKKIQDFIERIRNHE